MMTDNDGIWLIGLIETHVEVKLVDVEERAVDGLSEVDWVEYTEREDV